MGIADVGRDDDFFEVGGHSMRAVRTALRMEDVRPPGSPYINLYETPTIRTIMAELNGGPLGSPDRPLIGPVSAPLEMSHLA